MPRFTRSPDGPAETFALRIIRTPHTREITLLSTCTIHVGAYTHWFNGRTTPCEAPDPCPACQEGRSARWHGYISALLLPHAEHVLWEFTAPLLEQIDAYIKQHGDLRRAKLLARRIKPYPTSRQTIWLRPGDAGDPPLPPQPDIAKILLHIWGHDSERTDDLKTHPERGKLLHPSNHRKRPTQRLNPMDAFNPEDA